MGFTRYWRRPRELDPVKFRSFAEDCEQTCGGLNIEFVDAVFDEERVAFGAKPFCEWFQIERVSLNREHKGMVSEFCKTQQLPYDVAVMRCLELLKAHFGSEVDLPIPS